MTYRHIFCGLLLLVASHALGDNAYFLCGPDEDGCSAEYYHSCLCMPIDPQGAHQAYCLDFDQVACIPLSQKPNCPRRQIFADQSSCVATAFQSEPTPPCERTSREFCQQHHIAICTTDGGLASCH